VTEKDGTKTDQFASGAKGILTLYREGHSMLTIIGPDHSNPDELKYVSPSASSGGSRYSDMETCQLNRAANADYEPKPALNADVPHAGASPPQRSAG